MIHSIKLLKQVKPLAESNARLSGVSSDLYVPNIYTYPVGKKIFEELFTPGRNVVFGLDRIMREAVKQSTKKKLK